MCLAQYSSDTSHGFRPRGPFFGERAAFALKNKDFLGGGGGGGAGAGVRVWCGGTGKWCAGGGQGGARACFALGGGGRGQGKGSQARTFFGERAALASQLNHSTRKTKIFGGVAAGVRGGVAERGREGVGSGW